LKDAHDSEHNATVYAESLYEAVIRGLKMLEHVGWESDRDETIKQVEVEIHHEPTRHVVDIPQALEVGWGPPLCLCPRRKITGKRNYESCLA
jgi:hypothetical protein